jgi:hypothetical protein
VTSSRTHRILAATAVISALAMLMTTPAQALILKDGGGGVDVESTADSAYTPEAYSSRQPEQGSATTGFAPVAVQALGSRGEKLARAYGAAEIGTTVGSPGDGYGVSVQVEQPTVTSGGNDGFETGTLVAIAGGVVLAIVLGGVIFFTMRHRRIALP